MYGSRPTDRDKRPARRARQAAVVAALLAIALAGCGKSTSNALTIESASGAADSTTIVVTTVSCGAKPSLRIEETTERVTIWASRTVPKHESGDACLDSTTGQLAGVLGNRAIIDGDTGEVITVPRLGS